MTPSFAPLEPDAVAFLSAETKIRFDGVDFTDPRWFCVTVRGETGAPMTVIACQFKEWFDCHVSVAVADPRYVSRRLLTVVFQTLFRQAVRLTALISPDNEHAIAQARRLGFVYEGFLRMGVEGNRDALIFGMLREDCRFLPGYRPTVPPPLFSGGFHGLVS